MMIIQEDVRWKSSDRGLSGHSVGGHCVHTGAERQHQVGGKLVMIDCYIEQYLYILAVSLPTTLSGWMWETYSGTISAI